MNALYMYLTCFFVIAILSIEANCTLDQIKSHHHHVNQAESSLLGNGLLVTKK